MQFIILLLVNGVIFNENAIEKLEGIACTVLPKKVAIIFFKNITSVRNESVPLTSACSTCQREKV
jgi:hypothetical protein